MTTYTRCNAAAATGPNTIPVGTGAQALPVDAYPLRATAVLYAAAVVGAASGARSRRDLGRQTQSAVRIRVTAADDADGAELSMFTIELHRLFDRRVGPPAPGARWTRAAEHNPTRGDGTGEPPCQHISQKHNAPGRAAGHRTPLSPPLS